MSPTRRVQVPINRKGSRYEIPKLDCQAFLPFADDLGHRLSIRTPSHARKVYSGIFGLALIDLAIRVRQLDICEWCDVLSTPKPSSRPWFILMIAAFDW